MSRTQTVALVFGVGDDNPAVRIEGPGALPK